MFDRSIESYGNFGLGTLTTTGANETAKVSAPFGVSVPLLQSYFLTALYSTNDYPWYPVGISYIVTTGITVTAAQVTLRKNGVSAATGGVATLPIQATNANYFFSAFTPWTFAAQPAAGDQWSVLVTTTSTAGVVNPVVLWYAVKPVAGVTDGTTL